MELFSSSLADVLTKIAMFLVVQALVYLILSKSSDVFSKDKKPRSLSFKPARSVSIRRILAALSDLPAGGEPSPRPERPQVKEDDDDSSAN
ncbi:uncharacterized protein LOC115679220 [Syzygium oleosum]|uniref:uncharacterized protein LOC115679220 n=1 Tax=Syzygium oleosum TaxID=219896 RepID=UPI0024B8C40D|nr:uncharacterized protein LOC115679220 [Syzygium oleosum]